ncbi:cytochrome P450 2J6-like [Diadema antillarum]|uniref:cytochrome P450 2J6-like n=1 Tax=Diadema antillarum TaxID=105358 RepID=UPI003A838C32
MDPWYDIMKHELPTLLVFSVTFLLALYIFAKRAKGKASSGGHRTVPPAVPGAVSLFGNALSLKPNDEFLVQTQAWHGKYGAVFSLLVGPTITVFVDGMVAVREAAVKRAIEIGNRPVARQLFELNPTRLGIFSAPISSPWQTQRKFAHASFRGVGFGSVTLETIILDEANELLSHFKSKNGRSFDPQPCLYVSAANIGNQLLFGRRLQFDSERDDELMGNIRHLMFFRDDPLVMFFPLMWHVVKHSTRWRTVRQSWDKVMDFLRREVKEREGRLNLDDPQVKDFIDAYLVQEQKDPANFNHERLELVLVDLIVGGTDTISATLSWILLYLVTHPEDQKRIHDEINQVVQQGPVLWSHRTHLPYTEAAIMEVQRLACVAPMVPHKAMTDTELCGFHISKDWNVYLNVWAIHRNPDFWPEPDRFDLAQAVS